MKDTTLKYTNRLIDESSPYLLQHVHNPVDWYPYGKEALDRARAEDRPVFLSIGYSTCHWCHVMEKETFMDEKTAEILNRDFISIKVDREERPDLDHIYMKFTQEMTGQGGWPMNLILTPYLIPFYAATYIPPKAMYGRPGIREVLEGAIRFYRERKDSLLDRTTAVMAQVLERDRNEGSTELTVKLPVLLESLLKRRFDERYGGFGSEPKFPVPHNLMFLLGCTDRSLHNVKNGTEEGSYAEERHPSYLMVEKTLESIYRGGMHDHVGGGISRYSVDRFWFVPHFEKMLYDNALMLKVLSMASGIKDIPLYRNMAEDILQYLNSRMRSPEGLYYSAEDADSEGEEGRFYVFTYDEIRDVLSEGGFSPEDTEDFIRIYRVQGKGSFLGRNVLNLINSQVDVINGEDRRFLPMLKEIRKYRDRRMNPHRDEKHVFSWNAMVCESLASLYMTYGVREYLEGAVRLFEALEHHMMAEGRPVNTLMKGRRSSSKGVLENSAYGIEASITLYEATDDERYIIKAMDLMDSALEDFSDSQGGFRISSEKENLIINPVDAIDSAYPSANGIMAGNLLRLFRYTHEDRYLKSLDSLLMRFSWKMTDMPEGHVTLIHVLNEYLKDMKTVLITGHHEDKKRMENLRRDLKEEGNSGIIQIVTDRDVLKERSSFLKKIGTVPGRVEVRICRRGSCSLPEIYQEK